MQLNYNLYMNYSGYSISAQDYVLAMRRAQPDLDIRVNYLNQPDWLGVSKNRTQLFKSLQQKRNDSEQINLFHSIPPLFRRSITPKKHIGFAIFETINPPQEWINYMNQMDMIITGSEFNKNIFEKSGLHKPVHVIPHCFDAKLFNDEVKPTGRYARTTFISIGTWKNRKNWEMLIKAFYEGFESKDNVCLLIKTDKSQYLKSVVTRIKKTGPWRTKKTAPIYAEEEEHAIFEDIPQIMKKGDIYVSASLGEGFGLPGLHAMALGMPLITTRFGGSLEYAKEDLCTYIEPKGYKTYNDMDGIPQFRKCIWPVLRISDISSAMRDVWQNWPREQTIKAYRFVHDNFSYESIGPKFVEAVTNDKISS